MIGKISEVRDLFQGTRVEIAECICVDDESVDNSLPVLREICKKYAWVQVLTLSRNFGQLPATIAGIQHTSGDWVVTLDEDLQHDPSMVPMLLRHACLYCRDVVYGAAESAVHQSLFRDISSRVVKRLMATIARNPHIIKFSSFRVMRGSVARAAAASCANETYFVAKVGDIVLEPSALQLGRWVEFPFFGTADDGREARTSSKSFQATDTTKPRVQVAG